ncbi:MAG: transcriptional regulator [Candidatus Thorarchaeota archaeon]
MLTRRETIAELLETSDAPLTAQDICTILGIKNQSLVAEDIEHIAKSVKSKKKELIKVPARCTKCDYVFKKRSTAKKPSRCPKCRNEWIIAPAFFIRTRKK